MSRRQLLSFALLAVFIAVAGAEAAALPTCCKVRQGWAIGGELGVMGVLAEETVEALPAHAAEDLSRLTWDAPAGFAGVRISYRTAGVLRINGGVWYLVDVGGGTIKTPNGVYRPEEKPNYAMALHRVGIRVIWRRPYANS